MQVPVLIEPADGGRFRARTGEPLSASAEGNTAADACVQLEILLRERLQAGLRLTTIELENGRPEPAPVPVHFDPVAEDDWFFTTMGEGIAEQRAREDQATP